MTTKPLDLTKPLQCRNGVVPVIYCTDAPGEYPIHGRADGIMKPIAWDLMGHIDSYSPWDLVNVPEPLVVWISIYNDGAFLAHDSKESAKSGCPFPQDIIGRKRIVIENPEGFDDE